MAAALLLLSAQGAGEDAGSLSYPADGLGVRSVEGRQVIVLASGNGSPQSAAHSSRTFDVQSFETASRRKHVVTFQGRTYRASTPLEGPWSLVVFDTNRRKFASLLPSIRVELEGGVDLNAIAKALDATEVTVFDSLGFAYVDLPDGLHPADAVDRVHNLNGQPRAAMRLRRPRVQWR
ncbi:MAG: hypothetical protein OXG59_12780 [Gammaproteobacteria bacterium]|nr:hypothetical protein [Gammaproteobacteria bacterium]